MFYDHMQIIVH